MANTVDISADHLEIVRTILRKHLPSEVRVWVFGSRARGATRPYADLDLALEGRTALDPRTLDLLAEAFCESDLPWSVDLVDLHGVSDRFRQIVEAERTPFPAEAPSRPV